MAITHIEEIMGARYRSIDPQWRRTYKRAWRVVTEGPYDLGPLGATAAIPVFFGEAYSFRNSGGAVVEFDNAAFALKIETQIEPECNDDCSWIVAVEYGPYDPAQFPENPLNHPIKISWGENRFETPVFEDNDANAVVNSAGDYFDPPVQADDSRPTLRIVRNEPSYNPSYALTWKDTTNADAFYGFAPNTVKMSTPLGELEYSPICGFYYVVTYQFEINPNQWSKVILDQGTRQIVSGSKTNILDDNGDQITAPALLDGNGGKLPTGGVPVTMNFNVYQQSDFSQLNLDPYAAPGGL